MSGSVKLINITDERTKIIYQYNQFADILFDIAESAGINLDGLDEYSKIYAVNTLLRNFLGDEKYNSYIDNLKMPYNYKN